MADSIRVSLTPDKLTAQPDGKPVESVITIQNTGATVDQYAVELDQLPTTWYTLSNTSVALFPQDREEAKLQIHPPKGQAKAGTYPFTVTVLSRADSSQTTRAEGVLQVGAVAAFDVAMSPNRMVGRKGRYQLTLRNGGNADIDVNMEASDKDEAATYRFHPKEVSLAPGAKKVVTLDVKARRSNIAGAKKSVDFQGKLTPSQGEAKTVSGQFVHQPRFRNWRPVRRLAFLIGIIGILAAIYFALGGPSGFHTHVTNAKNSTQSFFCKHLSLFCNGSIKPGKNLPTVTLPGGTPLPTAVGGPVQAGPAMFVFAFKDFHDHDRTLVGDPVVNESTNNGVATQITTTGVLVYDHKSGHSYLIRNDTTVYEYFAGVTQQVR